MKHTHQVTVKNFDELSKAELYGIIALRMAVFCVEQDCPYQDLDDNDQDALHFFIKDESGIMAYARILKKNKQCSIIGRVVVAKTHRNKKLASIIMNQCIEHIKQNGIKKIELSAQSYLQDFYKNLGFVSTGHFYLEDDIPHQHMRLIFEQH